jgi:transcriptional regulator with XRE-family HTH domain
MPSLPPGAPPLCDDPTPQATLDPAAGDPRRPRLWRLARGLTQAQLAELSGLSKSSIERIEKSPDGAVNLRHLVLLALVLDCELLDVVDDDWLTYRAASVAAPAPRRSRLARSAGGPRPAHRRERASGRVDPAG